MPVSPLDVLPGEESSIELEVGRQISTSTGTIDCLPARTDRKRARRRPDRESIDGQHRQQRSSDDRILQAVRRIHEQEAVAPEMRSAARLAFLYPARVTYSDPIPAWRLAAAGGSRTTPEIKLDVVMTDLSAEGAGILVSTRHDPLPRRVSLVVDDNLFHCQVRWTKQVGGSVYRYGLVFRSVRVTESAKSPAVDRVSDS